MILEPKKIKSITIFNVLPWGWCHLHIWGYWYFSQQSWFWLVLHPSQDFSWCTLHIRNKTGWQYIALMFSFPNLQPVHCSMSCSNCCFLTCIQVSQQAGKVVWYSDLSKNFPQFVVIHIVKHFSIVNEEVDVLLEFFCFFYDPVDVDSLISGSSAFAISSLNIWKFSVHILWSLTWRILSITLLVCETSAIVQ